MKTIQERVDEETALIHKLEAQTAPPFTKPSKENNWQPDNTRYWEWRTALEDAYWRRRRLRDQLQN